MLNCVKPFKAPLLSNVTKYKTNLDVRKIIEFYFKITILVNVYFTLLYYDLGKFTIVKSHWVKLFPRNSIYIFRRAKFYELTWTTMTGKTGKYLTD